MASYNRSATKVKSNRRNPIKTLLMTNVILTTLVLLTQPIVVSTVRNIIEQLQK